MTKTKFTAFLAMGVVAVGLISHMHQEIQTSNYQNEVAAVASCEQVQASTIKKINAPSYQTKESLNTMTGLTAATRQDMEKGELAALNPEKVNCNISEVRSKFLAGVQKNNQRHLGNISMTTPG